MNYDKKNGGHAPFFITLMINNLLLHNCMLDYGASTNVMALKVMNQLGLKSQGLIGMYVVLIQGPFLFVVSLRTSRLA
jgi:hypothetical protein